MRSARKKDLLPLLGVGAAFVLFALAAARYPGGYDWASQTISSLFQPGTLDGAANLARPLAVLAAFTFCASMGMVFKSISRMAASRLYGKTIEIAGIGAMVYAFLVVTPMHDLLVGIALLFFVTAMLATFRVLYLERRFRMLGAGIVCISGTLGNASMYYGNVLFDVLPLVQKVSMILWVGWLLVLHVSVSRRERPSSETPRATQEPPSQPLRAPTSP